SVRGQPGVPHPLHRLTAVLGGRTPASVGHPVDTAGNLAAHPPLALHPAGGAVLGRLVRHVSIVSLKFRSVNSIVSLVSCLVSFSFISGRAVDCFPDHSDLRGGWVSRRVGELVSERAGGRRPGGAPHADERPGRLPPVCYAPVPTRRDTRTPEHHRPR